MYKTLLPQNKACERIMRGRFSGLKESVNNDKKKEKQKNEKNKIKGNNYFRKQTQTKPKVVKIDFSEQSFPNLGNNSTHVEVSSNENYLEKTKKIKEEKQKNNLKNVPDGWIILHKEMVTKNLINSEKDASRTRAIEIFPYFSGQLSKKKDNNKADAILIASFFFETYKKEE